MFLVCKRQKLDHIFRKFQIRKKIFLSIALAKQFTKFDGDIVSNIRDFHISIHQYIFFVFKRRKLDHIFKKFKILKKIFLSFFLAKPFTKFNEDSVANIRDLYISIHEY